MEMNLGNTNGKKKRTRYELSSLPFSHLQMKRNNNICALLCHFNFLYKFGLEHIFVAICIYCLYSRVLYVCGP